MRVVGLLFICLVIFGSSAEEVEKEDRDEEEEEEEGAPQNGGLEEGNPDEKTQNEAKPGQKPLLDENRDWKREESERKKKIKKQKENSPEAKAKRNADRALNWERINRISDQGVTIPLIETESDLYYYLVRWPRNYSLVVLFTSVDKSRCPICPSIETTFSKLHLAYVEKRKEHLEKSISETESVNNNENEKENAEDEFNSNIYFVKVLSGQHLLEAMRKLSIGVLPVVSFVPPAKKKGFKHKSDEYMYFKTPDDMMPDAMAVYLKQKSDVELEIPIEESWFIFLYRISKAALPFLIAAAILFGVLHRDKVFNFLYSKWSVFLICIGVYIITMNGTVYNAINEPPYKGGFGYMDRNPWIVPDLRSQYVFEGQVVASLLTFIAMLFTGLTLIVPLKKYGRWKYTLAGFTVIIALIFSLNLLMYIMAIKMKGYPLAFWFHFSSLFAPITKLTGIPPPEWMIEHLI